VHVMKDHSDDADSHTGDSSLEYDHQDNQQDDQDDQGGTKE
jgi:hypothetical protein